MQSVQKKKKLVQDFQQNIDLFCRIDEILSELQKPHGHKIYILPKKLCEDAARDYQHLKIVDARDHNGR
jgi:hypothetical protein